MSNARADNPEFFNDSIIQVLLPAPVVPRAETEVAAPKQWRRQLPNPLSYEPPSYAVRLDPPFCTVLFDSIAADTLPGFPRYIPTTERDSMLAVAEAELREDSIARTITIVRPSNTCVGVDPQPREQNYSNSTALSGLLAGVLALAALSSNSIRRTLKRYRRDLWSIRKRRNVFDDSKSVSLRAAIILAVIFCVFGGVVLYNIPFRPSHPSFGGAVIAMEILAGYYVAQLCAYMLIGYAFTTPLGIRHWLRGFTASQAYAAIGLVIPALLIINLPELHNILVIVSLAIYFGFRIVFVSKGFRIFYRNFESWLYFILYLCSIEIIPPVGIMLLLQSILSGTL